MSTIVRHSDGHDASAAVGMKVDDVGPFAGEEHLFEAVQGGDADLVGILRRVGADGGLYLGDGHHLACHHALGQGVESFTQSLVVPLEVAVARTPGTLMDEGLPESREMIPQMRLYHLEEGLTLLGGRRLVNLCRHRGGGTDISGAVFAFHVGEASDSAGCHLTGANLVDSCHRYLF